MENSLQLRRPNQNISLSQFDTFRQSRCTRRAQHQRNVIGQIDWFALKCSTVIQADLAHQVIQFRHLRILGVAAIVVNQNDRLNEFVLFRYGNGRLKHCIRRKYYFRSR